MSRVLEEFRAAFLKDIKIYSRYPSWVLGDVLVAPLWFLFFVLSVYIFSPPSSLTSSDMAQTLSSFFWGYTFVMLFNTGVVGIGQYMVIEQTSGTLEQILMAPINRLTIVAGRWAMAIVTDTIILSSTALFLVASQHVGIQLQHPLSLAAVLGLLEAALLGLGLTFAGVTLRLKGVVSAINYLWFGVVIFSGVFFPVTAFPASLEGLSLILPTTYYVDMIKHFAVGTPTILGSTVEGGLLCVFSVAILVIGWNVFGLMDRIVREQGTTGTY